MKLIKIDHRPKLWVDVQQARSGFDHPSNTSRRYSSVANWSTYTSKLDYIIIVLDYGVLSSRVSLKVIPVLLKYAILPNYCLGFFKIFQHFLQPFKLLSILN